MMLQCLTDTDPKSGGEPNTWLWPQLLPPLLNDDGSMLFSGIGGLVGTPYRPHARKIVFGTGFVSTYHDAPHVHIGAL